MFGGLANDEDALAISITYIYCRRASFSLPYWSSQFSKPLLFKNFYFRSSSHQRSFDGCLESFKATLITAEVAMM